MNYDSNDGGGSLDGRDDLDNNGDIMQVMIILEMAMIVVVMIRL